MSNVTPTTPLYTEHFPRMQCASRDDGRCQQAIDCGVEGLATCPVGKCYQQNPETPDPLERTVA